MKIRIIGAGWYGCSIALGLIADGHEVEILESADHLFAGASGANPARLHIGPHYPRSALTRAACRDHNVEFMARYGDLTRGVPTNIYAIAAHDSLVDFGTYKQVLRGEIEFLTVANPAEFGLQNVEGAILTGERHIVIREARQFFARALDGRVQFKSRPERIDDPAYDLTVDCSFCANDAEAIDRYEPCITVLLEGPTGTAVTIMDGPFPSLYPWDERDRLSSLTSALYTPLSKTCRTWLEARRMLDTATGNELHARAESMLNQIAHFWPPAKDLYRIADYKLSIRAMPRSAADARLVDVVRVGERAIRVRAGKIDAIFHAERIARDMLAAQQVRAAA